MGIGLFLNLPWRKSTPPQPQPGSSEWLLLRLIAAHERLLARLAEFHDLLQQPADLDREEAARRELAEAKRERAMAVQGALDFLLAEADAEDRNRLSELESVTRETLLASAEHLRTWTSVALAASWRQYGAAQRAVRSRWLNVIEAERAVLYPLLERHSALGGAAR